MSDRDERSRRIPDYDELREAQEQRRQMRWTRCLCGYPDMPGTCPGAHACPMHGEELAGEGGQ